MVQAPAEKLMLSAFLAMPETKPASEYIHGQIIQKPMPQGKHSRLQGKLAAAINHTLEAPRIACAFPELRCTFAGRSIIPDVSVFTWPHIPVDENGDVANEFNRYPDWMIEVLSPAQNSIQVIDKILHSLSHGTQMGWLIEPEARLILTYPQAQQPRSFEEGPDLLLVPAFAEPVKLTASDVFSWLGL
ncbi:MAG: Uma2 family endonuclease [Phormidesmis sp.]